MTGNSLVYNSQLDAFTLYHVVHESSPDAGPRTSIGPALPALGHALAGSLATAGAKVLLYPLDLVVTRLQVQRQLRGKGEASSAARNADAEYTSILDAVSKIYKNEGGARAFYTGCTGDVTKGIADSFLFFLAYTLLRQLELKRKNGQHLSVAKELRVGIVAGAFAKLMTTPIQTIVTRQQTAALVAARDPTSSTTPDQSDRLSMKGIALQIRSERGLLGFWAGYGASIILTLNPAITFAVDNLLKRLMLRSKLDSAGPHLTFLIAALSKALATTITYPVMLAKSRAQAAPVTVDEQDSQSHHAQAKSRAKTILRVFSAQYAILLSLRQIYLQEGFKGVYSGLEGEVLKGFLSHGLTMVAKEKAHIGVIQAYYLLLKLTRRWPAELEKAKDGAKGLAASAEERAANISVAIVDGAKSIVVEGEKG